MDWPWTRTPAKSTLGTSYDLLRCNLDGSSLETLVSYGSAFSVYGVALELVGAKVHWSTWDGSSGIRRANLDGTQNEVFASGNTHGNAIALYIPSTGGTPSADEEFVWTWMKGASSRYQTGTYGTRGVPNAANTPGMREHGVSWTDGSGAMWLFGVDGTGNADRLNDLWRGVASTHVAPKVLSTTPRRNALVQTFNTVDVFFDVNVTGVVAGNLLLNTSFSQNVPAVSVAGWGASRTFDFGFGPQGMPGSGVLDLVLAPGAIVNATDATPFEGDAWAYFLRVPTPAAAAEWAL